MIQRLATVGCTRRSNKITVIAVVRFGVGCSAIQLFSQILESCGNDTLPLSVIVVSASSESHDGVGAAMTLSVIPFPSSIPSVDCATSNGNSGIGDDNYFSWRACP